MDSGRETFITICAEGATKHIRVLEFDEVESTNDICKEMVDVEAKEPFVVRALFQRRGRGRYDREWISPRNKNLLFSIVMYPCVPVSKTPMITMLAAESVVEALKPRIQSVLSIKQPNDILCDGKKIAGILTEQESVGEKSSFVIVGIGLNVNASQDELPEEGTSLLSQEGNEFEIDQIFEDITEIFFNTMRKGSLV